MKQYSFLGGEAIKATNNLDLVYKMKTQVHNRCELLDEFMEELSHKLHTEKGTNINTRSVDKFVNDLLTHRLLTQLN
jgi:hypothetical protein